MTANRYNISVLWGAHIVLDGTCTATCGFELVRSMVCREFVKPDPAFVQEYFGTEAFTELLNTGHMTGEYTDETGSVFWTIALIVRGV